METSRIFYFATLAIVLAIAVSFDLRGHRIPNLLSLVAAVTGLSLHAWFSGLEGLGDSAVGLVVGVVTLLPLYLLGGMGAGDVKLMGAVGSLLGFEPALQAVLLTLIAGGLQACALLVFRGGLTPLVHRAGARPGNARPGKALSQGFAYSPAIAAGTLAATLWLGP